MQSNYSVPLTSCDQFKTTAIIDVITKLDKLNQVKTAVLSNINNKVTERITRLQSIKSRLVRLKEMIKIVSNQSKTVTIKSKRNYPKKKIILPYPALSSEENDINILRNIQNMDINDKINTKSVFADPDNNAIDSPDAKGYLKDAPSGTIEEALAMQIIINDSLHRYNEISRSIYEERFKKGLIAPKAGKEGTFEIDQNDKNSKFTLTNFAFINKKKINGHVKRMVEGDFVKLAETEAMVAFNKRMKEREKSKNIQEAPVSIMTNQKLGEYKDKVIFNLNQAEQTFDIDLPETLNLGNVAVIDRVSEVQENTEPEINNEDVQAQNEINEIFNQQDEGVDVLEEDEPVDWMKEKRIRNQNAINTNDNNNQNNMNNTQTTPTTISSPPSAPSAPAVNCNVKAVCGSGPGVPPPPPVPIPKAKAVPKKPPVQKQEEKKEEAKTEENKQEEGKTEEKKELSMEEQVQMAMGTLKKVGEQKVEEVAPTMSMEEQLKQSMKNLKKVGETKVETSNQPRPLSMEEQISMARGKLKKVNETKIDKKPEEDPNKGLSLVSL